MSDINIYSKKEAHIEGCNSLIKTYKKLINEEKNKINAQMMNNASKKVVKELIEEGYSKDIEFKDITDIPTSEWLIEGYEKKIKKIEEIRDNYKEDEES